MTTPRDFRNRNSGHVEPYDPCCSSVSYPSEAAVNKMPEPKAPPKEKKLHVSTGRKSG